MSVVTAAKAAIDLRYGRRTSDRPRLERAQPSVPANALVPISERRRAPVTYSRIRPQAAFVAHLIASNSDTPHLRARRRAEPETAVNAYERPLEWLPAVDRKL
jgi:hypothetical protein